MNPPNPLGLSRPGQVVVRAGVVAWSLVGMFLILYGLWRVAGRLRTALFVVGLAVLIVLILEPAVNQLQRLRLPRWASALVVYVAVLLPLGFGLWQLGSLLNAQLESLVSRGPDILDELGDFADVAWARLVELGVPMPADDPQTWLRDHRDEIVQQVISVLRAGRGLTTLVFTAVTGPVVAFYILVELPRIRAAAINVLPSTRRESVMEGFRILGRSVGAFFRGQLLIAFIVGLLSTIGLSLLNVRFAVLVGTIAGVSNLVPLFGPIVGGVPGVIIAWADGGPWLALAVVVLFVVVQQLESHLFSPLILGASMRLRPVAVILGMLVGLAAAGLLGMILAMPVMASASALYSRFGPHVVPDPEVVEAVEEKYEAAFGGAEPVIPGPQAPPIDEPDNGEPGGGEPTAP